MSYTSAYYGMACQRNMQNYPFGKMEAGDRVCLQQSQIQNTKDLQESHESAYWASLSFIIKPETGEYIEASGFWSAYPHITQV